jgi:hypothetical protein
LFIADTTFGQTIIQKKKSKPKPKPPQVYLFNIEVETSPTYDDNILGYSEKYREIFHEGTDKSRFQINTFDDVFFKNTVRASVETEFFKKLPTQLSVHLNYNTYINNPIKNWLFANIALKQDIAENASIKLGYSVIPYYYVRQYRDGDIYDASGDLTTSFRPYEYAKDNGYIGLQYGLFKYTNLLLNFSYYRYFLNQYFTEYDSKNYAVSIKVDQNIERTLKLSAAYNIMTSKAKGYDIPPIEPNLPPDDANASYDGESVTLGAELKLPRLFDCNNSFGVEFEYIADEYRSPLSPIADPLHSGREDRYMKFDVNYEFVFDRDFAVLLNYYYAQRRSGSVNSINTAYIADEKNFDQHRVGMTLIYKFQFKY